MRVGGGYSALRGAWDGSREYVVHNRISRSRLLRCARKDVVSKDGRSTQREPLRCLGTSEHCRQGESQHFFVGDVIRTFKFCSSDFLEYISSSDGIIISELLSLLSL